MTPQQFQALYCERYKCPPSDFEERVFRACLYWHARWLAPLARKVDRNFFAEDFKFIRYLGASTGLREVDVDVKNFHDVNLGKRGLWRTTLKIRVSGRKAALLARALYAKEPAAKAVA